MLVFPIILSLMILTDPWFSATLGITDLATGLMWMKQDSGHLKAGDPIFSVTPIQDARGRVDDADPKDVFGITNRAIAF